MQSRTVLAGAVVLAAVLVTAGVAGAFSPSDVTAQSDSNETIQVSAGGQVQAQADTAVVRVAVVTTGDDVETVRERLAANASSLTDALAEMGIAGDQVQTAYYDISSNQRYQNAEGEEPEYRAMHRFSVTVNDTDRVGEVIDTSVNNGANEIDGVEFTLSPDKRQELRQEALTEAMETARGEADTIAAASDLTVAGVDRVTTTQYSRTPYQAEAVAMAGDGAGTSINSGPVTVSADVTVVYDAESSS